MNSHISSFLIGEKIYLRPLEPCDSDYYKWFNDAETCAGNSHHVYPMTRSNVLDYIDGLDSRKDVLALAIMDYGAEVHIGNVSLQNIHPIYRSAELAIIIGDKNYIGLGYGFEACRLIVDHGFNAMNLHRISCGTFSTNIAMQKIARKLGMEREGIRKYAAFKAGAWVDVYEYGMCRFDK